MSDPTNDAKCGLCRYEGKHPVFCPDHCPDPSVHGNPFRYCPQCSWTEPVTVPKFSPLHQAMLDAGWTDDQIGAAMDAAAARG